MRYLKRYFRSNLVATTPAEEGREAQHLGPEVTSDVMLLENEIMEKVLRGYITKQIIEQQRGFHLVDF